MQKKVSKNLSYGLLALLFLLLFSTLTVARSTKNIYPLTNYFAFNEDGAIRHGVKNETLQTETGLNLHQITSEDPAYKLRTILKVPTHIFDSLSIKLQMTFTENYTEYIRWNFLRNITVNVYPFELATINSINESVQIVNALDIYHGTTVNFNINQTAFDSLEYFEVSFATWNEESVIQSISFEDIQFQQSAPPLSSDNYLILGSVFTLLYGVSFFFTDEKNWLLVILLIFTLIFVPITVLDRIKTLIDSLPKSEEGVSRFTFFNRVYERKDYPNGYYSLRMVKDLSTAFELVATSGTGSMVVYPVISESSINETITDQNTVTSISNDASSSELSTANYPEISLPRVLYSFSDITGSPNWWNASYKYVKQVTIDADSALGTNYTVQLDFTTSTLVSASKMRADARDLRVAYYSGSSWTELDRVVLNNNSATTSVFFRLENSISASGSDSNYAIYYGIKSGDPGNPPSNTTNIFLDDDDFSSGSLSSYSPSTGWIASATASKPTDIGWWTNDDIALGSTTADDPLNRSNLLTSNSEVLVLLRTTDSATSSRIGLRSDETTVDRIRLEHNSTDLLLTRYNGTTHTFDSDPGGFTASTWYFYKYQIVGSTLKGKAWAVGTTEPDWEVSSTESDIPSSGNLVFWSSTTGEDTDIGMWTVTAAVANAPMVTPDLEQVEVPEISDVLITNDDSGEIHAQRQEYNFRVVVTESVIPTNWVILNFTINSFEYSFGYDNITDSFTKLTDNAADYFILNAGGSGVSRSGNTLTVNFKITTDWDLPNAASIQLGAFANDTNGNWSTGNSGATTYDFNHDIQVSSFNVDDHYINPNYGTDLAFSGYVYYSGTAIAVPDSQIDQVEIYRVSGSLNVTNSFSAVSTFSVDVDSETSIGNYTYYPVVDLTGDGTTQTLSGTTTDVYVDRVEITSIIISAYKYDGGTRYWEDNDESGDAFTITITAEWDFTGNTYEGEVNVGYIGNTESYGPTSSLIRNDVQEDPASGTVQLRDDITVGSAIIGANNVYGTDVYVSASLPDIGWDNEAPSIAHDPSATSESSDYLYYDGTSNYGYYSDNMGSTLTPFNVGGTANDSSGEVSGLASITDNTNFGDNPARTGTLSDWIFVYDIDLSDTSYGIFTVTYTATDNVGNSNSATYQFRVDNTAPGIGSFELGLTADADSGGDGVDPDTGYYDDDSVDVTVTGTPTDGGSGVTLTTRYLFRTDDGSYGSTWLSGGATLTSVTEGLRTIYVLIRDNCGNNATDLDSLNVEVDLTDPSGFTSSLSETNNIQYLYLSAGTVYYNGGEDNLWFDITINAGTEINFWKVRFPAAFGELQEEDSTPSFRRLVDYDIDSTDVGTTIDVLVIDYAGNTQEISITVTEDSDAPTIDTLDLLLAADSDTVGNGITPDTGYYDDDTVDVTLSGSPTDSGSGLPTSRYSYKYDGGSYGSWVSGGTTVPSVPEGSRTIYIRVIDNVGNIASDIDSVSVEVDLTNPTGYTSTIYETGNDLYLYEDGSGTLLYFNGGQNNLKFDVGISAGVEANFWKVRQPAAFGESQEELTVADYRRATDYDIDSTDSGTTIDLLIIDFAGRAQTITITITEDSDAPALGTLDLLLTADTDSGADGVAPNTGYYDDDSVEVTIAGTPVESGSGLPSLAYGYRTDDGSYGSWLSSGTTLTSVSEGSRTIYVQLRDNVGNTASDLDSVSVEVDLTNPTGYTSSIVETNNIPYLYEDGSGLTIYFNGAYDDLGFDIEITAGTEANFWKVRQPAAFGESQEELTVAPFNRTIDYNIDSTDSGTTIDILIIDFAGNTQTISIAATEDSLAPTLGTLDLILTADTDTVGNTIDPDTGYYDDDSVEVTISGSPTDIGSDLPSLRYTYKYDGGSYGGSWLSGGTTLTSVPEGSRTIYIRVKDNVGNIATDLDSVSVEVDLTNPTGFTSSLHEVTNTEYLYVSSSTLIYFNGGENNLEFDIEANLGTEINFWKVRFPAAFGESQEEDSTPSYRRVIDYDIDSTDVGTTIDVLVIDRAGRSQTITITVTEDSTPPAIGTLNILLTTDTDSAGNGITPDTGYYDDASVVVSLTGAPTDGGSGLPTVRYGYRTDDTGYGSWLSSGTTLSSVTEGSRTIYVQVRDNVGNNATDLDSVNVEVDLTNPTGYTTTIYEMGNDQYLYEDGSGTLIYFNGGQNNLEFDIGVGAGTETNFWKVRQPAAFGESQEELTVADYRRTTDYDIDSTDSGTTIDLLVIDRAGRSQTIIITITEDSTAPTIGTLDILLTADTDSGTDSIDPDTGYYDDDSVDVSISGAPVDGGSGLPSLTYGYRTDDGGYGSWFSGGTTLSPVTEGSRTIYVRVRDNVGNIVTDLDSVNVEVDLTNPVGFTSTLYEISNGQYLYIGSSTLIYFNGAQDNLEFDVEISTGTEINFWKVRFPAAFGESQEEDSSPTYRRVVDYEIDSTDPGTTIDVLMIDYAGRIQTIAIDVTEDSTAPSLDSITADIDTNDSNADGYLPYNLAYGPTEAFYDQAGFTADISFTELGSGISSVQIRSNSGSLGSSVISGTNVPCTLTADSNNTIWYRFEDNVGNVIEQASDVNVYYGVSLPTNFDVDVNGALAWTTGTPNYVYIVDPTDVTSGTIYVNTGILDTWTISVDADGIANWQDGDIGWFVSFEAGWGAIEVNDTSGAPYQSNTYSTQGASEADLWIDIVNRCGIRRRITLLTTIDTTGPSMASITVRGNDSAPLEDWDQDGLGFSITPSTISDAGSGNNGYYVEVTDTSPDLYYSFEYVFPGFTYPVDVGSLPSYTFYVQPVDKVGNTGSVRNDIGYVDESPPASITTEFTNEGVSPNWFDQGTVSSGTFSITFNEDNIYSITVSVSGGLSATSASQGQSSPFASSITISGEADGTYDITLIITDKAGHVTTSFTGVNQIKLDNTDPIVDYYHLTNYVLETSEYLYWDSNNFVLWYGDDMGGTAQSFVVGINASDIGIGLDYAIASDNLGSNSPNTTEGVNPTYFVEVGGITASDSNTSDILISVYDLLGNSNTTTLSIDKDDVAPSGYLLDLIPDSTADIGYLPNSGYYDDDSVGVNTTEYGLITETEAGLPTNCYAYQFDSDGWSSWGSSDTFTFLTVANGAHNLYVHVRDNVGNNGTTQSNSTTVDTTSPSSFTLTWDGAGGYPDSAEVNATHIVFNSERDENFTVTVNNDGTIGSSLFWKIEWDKQGVFETAENDSGGLPDSKVFVYYQDSDGFFIIRLINNAGNYFQWNYTASADVLNFDFRIFSLSLS
ncbi:MAG: hypothetical protein ACXAC6_01295 [Candidatus Hodarchaeales archaeon]|jgi:tRNA(Leu) C34 or U34 (ribose-2'-O)-methylase TrmL